MNLGDILELFLRKIVIDIGPYLLKIFEYLSVVWFLKDTV